MIADRDLHDLLHDWVVAAEHDGGYVLGRCVVCGEQSLLDLAPVAQEG